MKFDPYNAKSLRRRVAVIFAVLGLCLLGVGAVAPEYASAQDAVPQDDDESADQVDEEPGEGVPYDVSIEGDVPEDILELFEASGKLFTLADRLPASEAALSRRVREDVEVFERILRSSGFYGATVTQALTREGERLGVVISVETGTVYRLESYEVLYETSPGDPAPPEISPEDLDVKAGAKAEAARINAAREMLLRRLGEQGYPLAAVLDQRAVVDHATELMTVTLQVDPGPYSRFGPLTIAGVESVDEDYLRAVIAWPQGDLFDNRRLGDVRSDLSDMNLFGSIRFELGSVLDEDGGLPVTLLLEEAKHRSIGLGASYSSDEGIGGEVFWEHRNYWNEGERLRLSLRGTEIRQSALAAFEKPNFWRKKQSLITTGEVRHQDSDAFEEKTIEGFIGLRREFDDVWSGSIGLRPEFSRIDDNESDETDYTGLGLPVTLTRDTSDDLLDPFSGSRVTFGVTPNVGDNSGSVSFLTTDNRGSAYWTPLESGLVTLAARTRVGATFGEDTDDIPAHRRLYSGGGGSVRGYEFQTLGPLDASNDPVGGRSVLELGFETRFRIGESYGFVPFVEGGSAYDKSFPDFSEEIRWAAGVGVRYYTVAGPLRFDIAFPLNPRRRDEDFEFYVSFGQAF